MRNGYVMRIARGFGVINRLQRPRSQGLRVWLCQRIVDEIPFAKGWGDIDFSLPTLDSKANCEDANHPVLRESRVRLYSAALST
jgi:hypothetical protein